MHGSLSSYGALTPGHRNSGGFTSMTTRLHGRRHLFARGVGGLFALFTIATAPALGDEAKFDVAPWIADLQQIRNAMSDKYANFEWVVFDREIDLSALFDQTEVRLRGARNDQDARNAIDRFLRAIGDGHLRVRWPTVAAAVPSPLPGMKSDFCSSLGYDVTMSGRALGPYIPGYHPLPDEFAPEFPSGVVTSGTNKIGVIRIGLFSPQGFPDLCASVRERLAIPEHSRCDQQCVDRLENAEYAAMSRDLALRVRELQRLGISVLLIDMTGNGGGSEWAEAAARIMSPLRLRSERRYAVRGAHWAGYWASRAQELRRAEQTASAADARQLEAWAQQVEQARVEASKPCSSAAFWSGHHPDCEWLAPAFYATGLLPDTARRCSTTNRGGRWYSALRSMTSKSPSGVGRSWCSWMEAQVQRLGSSQPFSRTTRPPSSWGPPPIRAAATQTVAHPRHSRTAMEFWSCQIVYESALTDRMRCVASTLTS